MSDSEATRTAVAARSIASGVSSTWQDIASTAAAVATVTSKERSVCCVRCRTEAVAGRLCPQFPLLLDRARWLLFDVDDPEREGSVGSRLCDGRRATG